MTDRELMQQALYALDTCDGHESLKGIQQWFDRDLVVSAVEALRARLAQPEPEPVAWYDVEHGEAETIWSSQRPPLEGDWKPLYTAPPRKEWQGLTDDERNGIINFIWMPLNKLEYDVSATIALAIEAKLKEKNSAPD